MQKLAYFLLLILGIGIHGSCQSQASENKINTSGSQGKDTRTVSSFNAIDLAISADVFVRQGGTQSLVLEGSDNDLEKVVTEVSGTELKIKTRPGTWRIGRVTIYITMQDVEKLHISGSGNIKSENGIQSKDLELSISGSGNITIPDLTTSKVNATISGSGNISYSGKSSAEESKVMVIGSGNIDAQEFTAKDTRVTITGSGDCKVNASENLDIMITGSGNVYYSGKAQINANVTGSGKVRQI